MRSLVPGKDFRSSLNSGSHKKKKFAVVFVTASLAIDSFFLFFFFVYRLCRVPGIKSYVLS